MNRLLLLIFIQLCLFGIIHGQYSHQDTMTFVFELKTEEARTLFQNQNNLGERYFHTLIDSFSYRRNPLTPIEYSNGHYLLARASGEAVSVSLESVNTISALVLPNKKDLLIQVFDSLGQQITNANVVIGKQQIPFKINKGGYFKSKWKKEGLVEISAQGETLFYQLRKDKHQWKFIKERYKYFLQGKVGRFVSTPVRFGKRIFYYFKNAMKYPNSSHSFVQNLKYKRANKIRYKGYTAVQQPVYQPRDTVKIKAYITNHRGKPLKKELNLKFYNSRSRNSKYFDIPIKPDKYGNYLYEFALGDSLKLDQKYSLTFYDQNPYLNNQFTQSFKYEDYQLDEVTWSFEVPKEIYNYGERIMLFAQGKDANGNTIPDGQIEIELLAGSANKYFDNPIYIPDTIWKWESALRTRGKTQIVLPDSLLPNANMNLRVKATLKNANGEIHTASKSFKIFRDRERIKTEIRNGYVYANYYKDGKKVDTTGTMEYWLYDEVDVYTEDTINFPFKQRINPYVMDYDFMVDEVFESVSLGAEHNEEVKSGVKIHGIWKNKEAQFQLINPHQIPVYYTIRTKDRVVLRDSSSKSEVIFSKSKFQGAYYVNYSFVWGGQTRESSNSLRPYKKQLSIKVEQASRVRPGDLVETKIEIRNYKGKVAKGVNLTAGAINTQFDESNNFKAPDISYKRKRAPFTYTNFSLDQPDLKLKQLSMSPFFYDQFQLEDHYFYKIRYDNPDRITLRYDTLTQAKFSDLAQVAPYLLSHGKEIPAEMIYINSKLVYYAGTTIKQPYSFLGYEGKNSITIRTKIREYRFDDIILKKGHKLEMIVNVDGPWHDGFQMGHSMKHVKSVLSLQEKKILNLTLFQYGSIVDRYSKKYLWQDNESVFVLPYGSGTKHHRIGPFTAGKPIGFAVQNKFLRKFVNIPGYRFELFPTQERLYASSLFDLGKEYKLSWRRGFTPMGQVVYTTDDIVTQSPVKRKITFDKPQYIKNEESGSYKFELSRDSLFTAVAITNEQDSLVWLLRSHVREIGALKAGNYQLYIFTNNGYYTKHPFTIKAAHLLHEDLSKCSYEKDSLDTHLMDMTYLIPSVPKRTMDKYTAQFLKKKQQGIFGKIKKPKPQSSAHDFSLRLLKDDLLVAQTKTDSSGFYMFNCYPGAYELNIQNNVDGSSFDFPVFITDSSAVRLDLTYFQTAFYLSEIIIIDYKMPLIEQDNTTQGAIITSSDIKNLPTRSINGLAATSAGVGSISNRDALAIRGSRTEGTVYVVDGVVMRGNMIKELDMSQLQLITGKVTDFNGEAIPFGTVTLYVDGKMIGGVETDFDGLFSIHVPFGDFELAASYVGYEPQRISSSSNSQYYEIQLEEGGGDSLNEVVVVAYGFDRSKKSSLGLESLSTEETSPTLEGGMQMRTDFKDYAFWQPDLITDKNGQASFQSIFPDKLTSWKTFVVGMDKKLRAGVAYTNTKSFKPLVAQLALPRFLIEGDKTNVIGKSVNYTQDVYPIETQFKQDGEVLVTNSVDLKDALIETTEIIAPLNVDSLSVNYQLQTGDYGDGEQRQIPIFPNGIRESIGSFHMLEGDTILSLEFDPKKGPITLYTESDALILMLEDLEYLRNYQYGCNEQTASRLMALLLEKKVRKQLNQPFENEEALIKMIVRLKKTQNEDGSWGWWANNVRSQWITMHVLKTLAEANKAGYTTSAFEKGIRFVTNFLPTNSPKQQLQILELLSSIGQQTNYEEYFSSLDTLTWKLKEQFTIIKIKQEQNLTYQLDSLEAHRRTTLFGGAFWGEESWSIMSDEVALTLLAYQIYLNAGKQDRIKPIRQYFMMRRSNLSGSYGRRFGRNTYETAKILATLLPDFLNKNTTGALTQNELKISGNTSETITGFPFKRMLNGTSKLLVEKKGNGILFLTAYQDFFNKSPKAKRDLFDVETKITQKGKTLQTLKQGERVQLIVDVKVDKYTEYAMIEIPIPASCSYFSKPNNFRGKEVHREYFRNKTAIFCRSLPKGEHQFTIDLETRFGGTYTLLPARVEQMYFPIFYGRNETREVRVE